MFAFDSRHVRKLPEKAFLGIPVFFSSNNLLINIKAHNDRKVTTNEILNSFHCIPSAGREYRLVSFLKFGMLYLSFLCHSA